MDYDKQRAFLVGQRWRLLPAAAGCGLLLGLSAHARAPLAARIAAGVLSLGLLSAAHYLPNYLGLDAAAVRRPRWVARARWFILLLAGILVAAAQAWLALASVAVGVALHFALLKTLRRPLAVDLRVPDPPRLAALAAAYVVSDLLVLWMAERGGVPDLLLAELTMLFAFLAVLLLRPRIFLQQILTGAVAAAALERLLAPASTSATAVVTCAAVFLWTTGVAHLYAKAVQQNRVNFDDLVENLQTFCNEPREMVVQNMAESVARLAENWRLESPQGQEAVTAWYSRNARLYLYANCQHHLLYKHIVYTLGLLRLARGRVLDFGGGPGNFSRALAREGRDTTYLDVPGESANYLRWRAERERLPLRIVHELGELEGPYDIVYALDVIEHLADLPPVFARWRELLRPGGRLVATYYNGPNSTAPMHIDPGHDARAYLLAHGFRDVKSALVGLSSPELMRKNHFLILERQDA
jgi:2-polyprenyl-3-methyl-5-hydroxy-6-metoxy-1,4-benzoquinol methylase